MGGEPDSAVPRATVLRVLRAHRVGVSEENGPAAGSTFLSKGDVVEVHHLPDPVHRRMLHALARKFDVPIHHFYRPGLIAQMSAPDINTGPTALT